jgi:phosphoribosylamine--glycine ligase
MIPKLKLFVIGGGGREHALVWKLAQSPRAGQIFCAPGNAGIASHAQCIPIPADDLDGLVAFARKEAVDLVVVGPEVPLIAGITDRLRAEGIATFGPTAAAAQIEGSKAWARDFMVRAGLPIPWYATFSQSEEAEAFLHAHPGPVVVKADGPAAGKGAVVCDTTGEAVAAAREMLVDRVFGESGARVVLEERLVGEEFSAMAFLQGDVVHPMPCSQDHKRALDGDRGLNTGGMGAYTPVQAVTREIERQVVDMILRPLAETFLAEGIPYHGILYPGLMLTESGVKIIEFNCRFGDPEAEVLIPLMDFDLLEILEAGARGDLTSDIELKWKSDACACIVMASGGYPEAYETGKPIHGLEAAGKLADAKVFHCGTKAGPNGEVLTAGGRVLGVTAWGAGERTALARAYDAAAKINWEDAFYRHDIGYRLLNVTS